MSEKRTKCVLGTPKGHPPALRFRTVLKNESDVEQCLTLKTNGLEIITKRTVFDPGQHTTMLVCSNCNQRMEAPEEWSDAISEWYDDRGAGNLHCPLCNFGQPVKEWRHDPNWAFGNLGFTFWNWPSLKPSFIAEFETRLKHRTVLVSGKL